MDLPAKLRRSVGRGEVLDPEVVANQLVPFDKDGDGRLTKSELSRFLAESGLGGPWFCDMFASTVWRKSQQTFERDMASLAIPLLAKVIHFAMARTSHPGRRYVITPEAFRGEAPRVDAQDRPVDVPAADAKKGAPRPAGPSPRGPAPRGRGPAPRKGPAAPGRGSGRGPSGRGPSGRGPTGRSPAPRGRPAGRSGPRRPSGRPRS